MSLSDVIQSHLTTLREDMFTSLPATIVRVNEVNGSTVADVQLAIRYKTRQGVIYEEDVLLDVPIMFPSVKDCYITFPVEVGDEVMVTFAMRDCGEWLSSGDERSTPYSYRTHNISDAFATPTVMKQGKAPKAEKDCVVIKSKDSVITLKKDGNIEIGEGASQALILGNKFMEEFDKLKELLETHTHGNGNEGLPTGPPEEDPTYDFSEVLSETVRTV